MPAQAGIQLVAMDSCFRGNDKLKMELERRLPDEALLSRRFGIMQIHSTDLGPCGPLVALVTKTSTALVGPETSASTEPSERLRTQPSSFCASAAIARKSRNPMPWTKPCT